MLPGTLPNFAAACYASQDHIGAHTDEVPEVRLTCFHVTLKELSAVELQRVRAAYGRGSCEAAAKRWREAPRVKEAARGRTAWRRQVAAAYYLNKDWRRSWGGEFIDLAGEEALKVRDLWRPVRRWRRPSTPWLPSASQGSMPWLRWPKASGATRSSAGGWPRPRRPRPRPRR